MAANTTVETPNPVEQMSRTWLATLDGMYRLQEQNEKMLISMLEYNRQAREEGRRMAEKMLNAVAENQKQVAALVDSATRVMVDGFRVPVTTEKK